MSPLTKAFVVLVTILSVLLVALVVPFVAQTQNFNDQVRQEQAARATAEQSAKISQAEISVYQQRLSDAQQQAAAQRDALTARITELQGQLQDVRTESAQNRSQLTQAQATLAQLGARAELDASQLATLQTELNAAREEQVNVRGQNIELQDQAVAIQAQMAAMDRQVRRLREQMAQMQDESNRLNGLVQQLSSLPGAEEMIGRTGPRTTQAAGTPAPTVQGQVTQVRQLDGTTLVQVNIGRSDQLQAGNELIVARGDNYLGTLLLEEVRDQEAVGRMTLLASGAQVQQGDTVVGGQGGQF